jgi:tetratricopeptide (TPR) repeat protein
MKICTNCNKKVSFWKNLGKKESTLCEECNEKFSKEKEFNDLLNQALSIKDKNDQDLEEVYYKVLSFQISTPKALNSKARIKELLNKPEDALALYNEGLTIDPDNMILARNKALLLFDQAKYEESFENFTKLLKKEPDNWEFNFYKGLILLSQKRKKEAFETYNKQLRCEVLNPEDFIFKGRMYLVLKNYKESLESLDKAIELSMNKSKALTYKAIALIELRRYLEAIFLLEKALDTYPDNDLAKRVVLNLPETIRKSPLEFQDNTGKKIELKNISLILKKNNKKL